MEKITIRTSKEYSVLVEDGLLAKAGQLISEAIPSRDEEEKRKVCIVCDKNVYRLYGREFQPLQQSIVDAGFRLHIYVFPAGEKNKTLETAIAVTSFLAENDFTRSDIVVALGGGVAGDIAGFASSIYMRGISFVQIPTTLLAMADSSIGGKTGVNAFGGKNMLGTFRQPDLVIADPRALETLSGGRLLDGLAEIIKAGFIGDVTIFDTISEGLVPAAVKAIKVKKDIVEKDERESGLRRLLNFGHTIGHAIEKCSDFRISHGVAIMTGMYITALAAETCGWTMSTISDNIRQVIDAFDYPVILKYSAEELAIAALCDKKRSGSEITIIYPDKPGRCQMKSLPEKDLEHFISQGLEKARS